jgi:hypothetical protein
MDPENSSFLLRPVSPYCFGGKVSIGFHYSAPSLARVSCAHSAASCSARLQRIEATGAGSIPTAPTNVYFIINGLREAEGALGAVG